MIASNTKGGVWNRQLRAPARIQLILHLIGQLRACRCAAVAASRAVEWWPHSQWWLLGAQRETQVPEQRPLGPLAPLPISPVDWRRPSQPSVNSDFGLMFSWPADEVGTTHHQLSSTTRPGPISQSPAVGYHPVDWTGPSLSGRLLAKNAHVSIRSHLFDDSCSRQGWRQEGLTTRGDGSENMRYEYRPLLLLSYNNMNYSRRQRRFLVINNTTVGDVRPPPLY